MATTGMLGFLFLLMFMLVCYSPSIFLLFVMVMGIGFFAAKSMPEVQEAIPHSYRQQIAPWLSATWAPWQQPQKRDRVSFKP